MSTASLEPAYQGHFAGGLVAVGEDQAGESADGEDDQVADYADHVVVQAELARVEGGPGGESQARGDGDVGGGCARARDQEG